MVGPTPARRRAGLLSPARLASRAPPRRCRLEAGELLLQRGDETGDAFSALSVRRFCAGARDDHLDDLASPSDKIGQSRFVRRARPDVRFGRLDEWRSPPRRSDRSWPVFRAPWRARTCAGLTTTTGRLAAEARRDDRLIAAGRLDRDRLGSSGASWRSALRPSASRSTRTSPRRTHRHVQPILRYVDADNDASSCPVLAQAASLRPATVRSMTRRDPSPTLSLHPSPPPTISFTTEYKDARAIRA